MWHPDSCLVFKSEKERVVTGKCSPDNKIHPLTPEDIDMCKSYNFKYETKQEVETDEEAKAKDFKEKISKCVHSQANQVEDILSEILLNDKYSDSEENEEEYLEEEEEIKE